MTALQKGQAKRAAAVTTLQADQAELAADMKALQKAHAELAAKVATLKADIAELAAKVATLERAWLWGLPTLLLLLACVAGLCAAVRGTLRGRTPERTPERPPEAVVPEDVTAEEVAPEKLSDAVVGGLRRASRALVRSGQHTVVVASSSGTRFIPQLGELLRPMRWCMDTGESVLIVLLVECSATFAHVGLFTEVAFELGIRDRALALVLKGSPLVLTSTADVSRDGVLQQLLQRLAVGPDPVLRWREGAEIQYVWPQHA